MRRLVVAAIVLTFTLVGFGLGQDKEKKKKSKPRPPSSYKFGLDSLEQKGVPRGKVIKMPVLKSKVFDGTEREWWLYVPAQYDAKTPACVMVFQDGQWYVDLKGDYRVPTVFDNLIHQKKMPVTIGIFLRPGEEPSKVKGTKGRDNRSVEYDTLSDQYAKFLEKEVLPAVAKDYNLRKDGAGRAIGGISSGGICSFTVAWQRPDLFTKVLSHVGSFTNIRGGDAYPGIIRRQKTKDIRVFLQAGKKDLDNQFGNWYLGNLQMEAALKYKRYAYKFVAGEDGHDGRHGGAILPESLIWLWEPEVKKE